MIALTDAIRKGSLGAYFRAERGESSDSSRHGIVSGITIQPLFRQPPAALDCEKNALRWPGSFGFGFLSPQPPGIVGTGPSAANQRANVSWPFFVVQFANFLFVIPGREQSERAMMRDCASENP